MLLVSWFAPSIVETNSQLLEHQFRDSILGWYALLEQVQWTCYMTCYCQNIAASVQYVTPMGLYFHSIFCLLPNWLLYLASNIATTHNLTIHKYETNTKNWKKTNSIKSCGSFLTFHLGDNCQNITHTIGAIWANYNNSILFINKI